MLYSSASVAQFLLPEVLLIARVQVGVQRHAVCILGGLEAARETVDAQEMKEELQKVKEEAERNSSAIPDGLGLGKVAA